MEKSDPDGKLIKIEVTGDSAAAEHFLSWLCGSGEQEYWQWMEARETEESGPITIVHFSYDFKKGVIAGKLGRFSPDIDDNED